MVVSGEISGRCQGVLEEMHDKFYLDLRLWCELAHFRLKVRRVALSQHLIVPDRVIEIGSSGSYVIYDKVVSMFYSCFCLQGDYPAWWKNP